MLLGSTRSVGPSERRGRTRLTGTRPESGAVAAALSSVFCRRRGTTPIATSTMRTVRPTTAAHVFGFLGMYGLLDSARRGAVFRFGLAEKVLPRRTTAQQAVHDRHEEQGGERRHRQ